jgi:predicted O-methyltransferase YrrM
MLPRRVTPIFGLSEICGELFGCLTSDSGDLSCAGLGSAVLRGWPMRRVMTGTVPVMTLTNIARNAVRPSYLPEMVRKVYERARYGTREAEAGRAWAAAHESDLDAWARARDGALWDEALTFANQMMVDVKPRMDELDRLGIDLGGGGCYELLYFLTRLRRPAIILETGVAAGWSSRALLSAIQVNGQGKLLSSDFPYFRMADPERYVGYLVPDELKGPWEVRLRGDRANLKQMLTPDIKVGLVHYDSDKSRGGRQFFCRAIAPHLASGAVVMMDDIGDNLFFRDYTASREFHVFSYQGKHFGIVQSPNA